MANSDDHGVAIASPTYAHDVMREAADRVARESGIQIDSVDFDWERVGGVMKPIRVAIRTAHLLRLDGKR